MGFTPNPEKQDFIRLRLVKEPHPGGRTTDKAKKYYGGLYHRMDKDARSQEVADWRAAQGTGEDAATADTLQSTEGNVGAEKANGASPNASDDATDPVNQPSEAKSVNSSANPSRRQTRSSSQSVQAAAATAAAEHPDDNAQDDNANKNQESIDQENVDSTRVASAQSSRKSNSLGRGEPAEQTQDAQKDEQIKTSDESAILLDFADDPIETETAKTEYTDDDDSAVDKTLAEAPPSVGGDESAAAEGDTNLDTPANDEEPANVDEAEQFAPQIAEEDAGADANVDHPEPPKDTDTAASAYADDRSAAPELTAESDADDHETTGSADTTVAQLLSSPSPTGAVAGSVPAGGATTGIWTDEQEDGNLDSLFVSDENDVSDAAEAEMKQADHQSNDDTAKADTIDVASFPPASQLDQEPPQETTPPLGNPIQEDDDKSEKSPHYSADEGSDSDVNEVQQQDSDADESDNEQQDPSTGVVGEGVFNLRDEQELEDAQHDGGDHEWGDTGEYLRPEAGNTFLPDHLLPESLEQPSQSSPPPAGAEAEGQGEDEKKRKLPEELSSLSPELRAAYVSSADAQDPGQCANDVAAPEGPKQKRPRLRKPGRPPLPREGEQSQSPSLQPAPTQPAENGAEGQAPVAPKSFLSDILHDAATKPQYQWRPSQ